MLRAFFDMRVAAAADARCLMMSPIFVDATLRVMRRERAAARVAYVIRRYAMPLRY